MNECAGEIDFAVGKAKCNRQKSMSIQLLMCLENQFQIFQLQKYCVRCQKKKDDFKKNVGIISTGQR